MKIKFSWRLSEETLVFIDTRRMNAQIQLGITAPVARGDSILSEDPGESVPATIAACGLFLSALKQYLEGKDKTLDLSVEELAKRMTVLRALTYGKPCADHLSDPVLAGLLLSKMRFFKEADLLENPYFRSIHLDNITEGNFSIETAHYVPRLLFFYDEAEVLPYGITLPSIGMAEEEIPYLCLSEGDTFWMSITPNEIYTMVQPLRQAHGKVLTLGCGLGYFAYMAALKEDVESVTIVEREASVITLFEKHILPQFPDPAKIKVIKSDAFAFMEDLLDGDYDFCFADIWRSNKDVYPYLKMRAICNRFKKMEMTYWLEKNLNLSLLSNFLMYLAGQLAKAKALWCKTAPFNAFEDESVKSEVDTDLFELWAWLYRKVQIETPEQLREIGTYKDFAPRLANKNLKKCLFFEKH